MSTIHASGSPAWEHGQGWHGDGNASADCLICAQLGWLLEVDDAALVDPNVRAEVTRQRARARICFICKGELMDDGQHRHDEDFQLHDEMVAHQDHLKRAEYPVHRCSLCVELYDRASQNHREHAGAGTGVHSVQDCIAAYRRYAEMMSRD